MDSKSKAYEPVENSVEEHFSGRIFRMYTENTKTDSGYLKFEYAERSPGVRVIAHDRKAEKILITKEWRIEYEDWDYRLPGGKVFDSLSDYLSHTSDDINDYLIEASIRELKEETGVVAKKDDFQYFFKSVCGSTVIWDLHYLIVDIKRVDVSESENIHGVEGERIIPLWFDREEVLKMCIDGRIKEDRSSNSLMRYILGHRNG